MEVKSQEMQKKHSHIAVESAAHRMARVRAASLGVSMKDYITSLINREVRDAKK